MFQIGKQNMQRPKGGRGYGILKERLEWQARPKQGCLVGQVREYICCPIGVGKHHFKQGSYISDWYFRPHLWHGAAKKKKKNSYRGQKSTMGFTGCICQDASLLWLLHCRRILYPLSPQGSPSQTYYVPDRTSDFPTTCYPSFSIPRNAPSPLICSRQRPVSLCPTPLPVLWNLPYRCIYIHVIKLLSQQCYPIELSEMMGILLSLHCLIW